MAAQVPNAFAVPSEADLLQAQADLWRHSLYYLKQMALKCAVELGIPTAIDRLGGATSLPDLITALSLPPAKLPYLGRLMRLLAMSGVFADTVIGSVGTGVTTYGLTPLSYILVDGVLVDGDAHQKAIVLTTSSRYYVEAAMGMADWFRKDHAASASGSPPLPPFEEVHGAALYDGSMARLDPEHHGLFNEALAAHDNMGIGAVLWQCGGVFMGLRSMTDCCGGDGTAARAIVCCRF